MRVLTALCLGMVATGVSCRMTVRVDGTQHTLFVDDVPHLVGGDTCVTADAKTYCAGDSTLKVVKTETYNGTDAYGTFAASTTQWGPVAFRTTVFTYDDGETVLYRQEFPTGLNGTNVSSNDALVSQYPSFVVEGVTTTPGYLQYRGAMLGASYKVGHTQDISDMAGGLENSGPLVLFSNTTSLVISSASQFMAHSQALQDSKNVAFGVMGGVTSIPAGFTLDTIVSLGDGSPAKSMHRWGEKLLRRYGKDRETAASDFTTNYLGYSTDNGAWYYYTTEEGKSYEETMLDVYTNAQKEKVPYKHWLMDSWWYFKGDGNGVKNWTAMPSIFPNGIDAVYKGTGEWPIVAHNRYWSANTDYAKQNGGQWDFIIEQDSHSGLAMPLQQEFWDWLMADAKKWGLHTYEQDWLFNEFSEMKCTTQSATLARQWLMQMGTAAARNSLTIQYCMSWPRHMMQSIELQAVTQARASGDYHPGNDQWRALGVTSIFGHAIAVKPTKDNFWTKDNAPKSPKYGTVQERYNRLQSAVSTLSTGPVAPSDKIGYSDVALIMKSTTAGGKLLAPDTPATLIDSAFYKMAGIGNGPTGSVWAATTFLNGAEYKYVLAAENSAYMLQVGELFEETHERYAWEANTTTPQPFHAEAPVSLPATDKWSFNMWTVAPVLANGYVLMGELSKWVSVSSSRYSNLAVSTQSATVELSGFPGEIVETTVLIGGTQHVFPCTVTESSRVLLSLTDGSCTPV